MIFVEEDKYKKCIGIYSIRNIINNNVYIGQTTQSFQKRYWNHQWKLKDNSHDNYHLQASWNKYGEDNFVFEIVQCISQEEIKNIDELEINYIKKYKDINLSYNISSGGDGTRGVPMSEYAKKIVGKANREHNLGKHASEETKRKMSESHKKNGKQIARNRDRTILNEDIVKKIKEKLVCGVSDINISKEYNYNISTIRNIKYNTTWADIEVDGWNEYLETIPHRVKTKSDKYTEDEINNIINDYINGESLRSIELKYHRSKKKISKIIKERNITRQSCAKSQ